jgi:hypothetical protein
MAIIDDILRKFPVRHPFTSAKVMRCHLIVNSSTVKEVLSRELGFRKYARRWVSHLLDEAQKSHRRKLAIELLELLRGRKAYDLDGIAAGDESWFHCHYDPHEMFAAPREKVIPVVRTRLGFQSHDHRFL